MPLETRPCVRAFSSLRALPLMLTVALVLTPSLLRTDFNVPLSPRKGDGLYFSSGEKVPNAAYKLLIRALKFFGDVSNEDDYETWLSPAFAVNQY
jgi:hypothetical protein